MKPDDLLLDDTFLAWYFRSDPKAVLKWNAVRETDPILKNQMDEAVRLLETISSSEVLVPDQKLVTAQQRLHTRIGNWEQDKNVPQRSIGRRLLGWTGAAASVAVLVMLAYWLFPAQHSSYKTVPGESRIIELSDGSVVNMNGGSTLDIRLENGKDREVWLVGEAFFKVSKLADSRKFIVHTGDLNVEVLGTEFNVKGRAEKTVVVLESGKVALSSTRLQQETMLMKPGEKAEFSKQTGKITKQDVNTRVYTSWKEGKVLFENADINDIAEILQDRYGLNVQIREGSKLGEFNGLFPVDNKEIVITALKKTYPGRISRINDTIQIR